VLLRPRPLHVAQSLVAARFGARVPLKVTHLLTYACNVECGFCTRIHVPAEPMREADVFGMIDAFAGLGTSWWVMNGGEPTLVKPLPDYIDRAKSHGMNVSMVTNGTQLLRRADELKRLDLVICSVHGDRAEHDRVVQRQGAWDGAIDGVKAMRDRGVDVVLLCVLNERNVPLLDRMLLLGEQLGVGVAFQPVTDTRLGGAFIDRSLLPDRDAMSAAIDSLLAWKSEGRPLSGSREYLEAVRASWPDRPFPVPCWAGRLFCEVTPEGYVVSCCSEEEHLDPARHGPSVGWREAWDVLPDRSHCRACSFKGPQELNLLLGMAPSRLARAAANAARGRMLWN
jgi:MoaA/NifB/PqqE/SkfB family radical SAM enzyme